MQAKPIDSLTSPAAKKYQAMKNRLFLFNLIAEFLFLFLLVFTGWSRQLKIFLLHFRDDFVCPQRVVFYFF